MDKRQELLDNAFAFAMETSNHDMIGWVFREGTPTNIEKIPPAPMMKKEPRPFVVYNIELKMSEIYAKKNSLLMVTIQMNPAKAYEDLTNGEVSLEEINHTNEKTWSVLDYVCFHHKKIPGAEMIVKQLLELGADVNAKYLDYGSPLMICANKDSTNIFEILLRQPTLDVNQICDDRTVLLKACESIKSTEDKIFPMILQHSKLDVNLGYKLTGVTALMMACQKYENDTDLGKWMIKLLMNDSKIDIYQKDKTGKSAIAYCPKSYQTEVFELLTRKN